MNITIKYKIVGIVQGVFFRYHTKKTADSIGLKGYVKNLENGDVEVVATGVEEQLDKLTKFCKKGPINSLVKEIKFQKIEKKEFDDFSIKN